MTAKLAKNSDIDRQFTRPNVPNDSHLFTPLISHCTLYLDWSSMHIAQYTFFPFQTYLHSHRTFITVLACNGFLKSCSMPYGLQILSSNHINVMKEQHFYKTKWLTGRPTPTSPLNSCSTDFLLNLLFMAFTCGNW